MKNGTQNYGIFVDKNKRFIGISLGNDFCAEHEWGHDEIKRNFGIPEMTKKTLGVKCRTITKCIDNLIFKKETYKKKKFAILYSGSSWRSKEDCENEIPFPLKNYKKNIEWRVQYDEKNPREGEEPNDPISTAWDSASFGVGVMGEENVENLNELYQAFLNKNITIAYVNSMPHNPFSNSSLTLMITDRIPEEYTEMMYVADKEHYDLIEYEKQIGIAKLKERKRGSYSEGKKYFIACSPKWINYYDEEAREAKKKELGTKFNIWFWINYSDNDNTHGYFIAEEIKEWLKGDKKLSEIRARNESKKK